MSTRRLPVRLSALPRPPDQSAGRCAAPGVNAGLWTSHLPSEREAARWLCKACPALAACREWAMNLPVSDYAIWAGLSHTERAQLKRERSQAAAAPWGMPVLNAAKAECRYGHKLEGGNVVMVPGRGGRLFRRCRACFRRRNAAAERLRRRLARERLTAAA